MVQDFCTKMNMQYTITQKRILQDKTFITKISTGLNPTDILVITFHIVLSETGGGKNYLL